MPAKNNNISALTWVIISAIGLIIFLGAAVTLIYFSNKVDYIKPQIYYFLLVIIGLVSAGFLSGAMRAHAKYSGKVYGGMLELGGPAVIFALVIYLGIKFKPDPSLSQGPFSFKITVFASASKDELVSNGLLQLILNRPDSQKIVNGLANFEIDTKYKGKDLTVIPVVEGYYRQGQTIIVPADGSTVELHLQKIPDSTSVNGTVVNRKGQPVKNAAIVFENGIAKDTSDQQGIFRLTLPYKDGREINVKVYGANNDLLYNSLQLVSEKTAMTLQISQ